MSFRPVTIEFIKIVARALGELNEKAVFVGGATVPFYLPEDIKGSARATEDIDIVVEILRRTQREEFEKLLRQKGFNNDMSERAPLCRWIYRDMIVDIMSPEEKVLGFSNRWYKKGMEFSWQMQLEPGLEIKMLSWLEKQSADPVVSAFVGEIFDKM